MNRHARRCAAKVQAARDGIAHDCAVEAFGIWSQATSLTDQAPDDPRHLASLTDQVWDDGLVALKRTTALLVAQMLERATFPISELERASVHLTAELEVSRLFREMAERFVASCHAKITAAA